MVALFVFNRSQDSLCHAQWRGASELRWGDAIDLYIDRLTAAIVETDNGDSGEEIDRDDGSTEVDISHGMVEVKIDTVLFTRAWCQQWSQRVGMRRHFRIAHPHCIHIVPVAREHLPQ